MDRQHLPRAAARARRSGGPPLSGGTVHARRSPPAATAAAHGHSLAALPISPPVQTAPIQLGRTKAPTASRRAPGRPRRKVPFKAPRQPPKKRIRVQAFNVGHASASKATGFKLDLLQQHLEEHAPDLLALSEVNDATSLRERFGSEESGYHLIEPPELSVGTSTYNPKTSTQYENYPLLVRKESGLDATYVGLAPRVTSSEEAQQVKQDERGSSSVAWKHYRPLPLFAITHPEGGSFVLGPVHTSPGSTIADQTVAYGEQLGSVLDAFSETGRKNEEVEKPPGLLAGDFYNPSSAKGKAKVSTLGGNWEISRPDELTNFHPRQKDQEKEAADFFIGTKGLIDKESTQAIFPSFTGAEDFANPAEAWAKYPQDQLPNAEPAPRRGRKRKAPARTVAASDHAPVETNVLIRNAHRKHDAFVRKVRRAITIAQARGQTELAQRRLERGLRTNRKRPQRLVEEIGTRARKPRTKIVRKR